MQVLEQLERGELSIDEALDLLSGDKPHPEKRWQRPPALLIPGIALILFSSVWMAARLQSAGMDIWFLCAWVPLILGVVFVTFAWAGKFFPDEKI